jgi:23S rRNA (pseudouridine1915-N3)-methyltransferase
LPPIPAYLAKVNVLKIAIWAFGKPHDPAIASAIRDYSERIARYHSLDWKLIDPPRGAGSLTESHLKKEEAIQVLHLLKPRDCLLLLEEKGKSLSSAAFARVFAEFLAEGHSRIVFLIGGAFGVDVSVGERANYRWSLSELTFPHQLVRLMLAEQIYRACSMLRGEKYHHP